MYIYRAGVVIIHVCLLCVCVCVCKMTYEHIWVVSLFGLVLRAAESLSETAVTHRPQAVIIVGIYMSSKYLLLLLS